MNIFVLLSVFSFISAAPAPEEVDVVPYVHEEIEALPYVHDATGDVSDDSSPEALAYVHDVTGDVSDDSSPAAVPYVHQEPVQVAVLPYPYSPVVTAYTAGKVAVVSPYLYAHTTGCVNSVGSVVPCNV